MSTQQPRNDSRNGELAAFLTQHSRPHILDTIERQRPAFAADIKEGKNSAAYNAHSYHTKVPPRSIVPYILHYTAPGDVVLDLFCGSGMTGVAAQMCVDPPADILEQFPDLKDRVGPRSCVLNDLSPAACHIAYNFNTPVDIVAFRSEVDRIKSAVKGEIDWLYATEHYEPAVGTYDPTHPTVARQLKNPPAGTSWHALLDEQEPTWELLDKTEVEKRLGYPIVDLKRNANKWGELDLAKIEQWLCIPAVVQYTVWSDVYRCEGLVTIEEPTGKISMRGKNAGKPVVAKKRVQRGCGSEMVWWDIASDASESESSRFACPTCGQLWQKVQVQRVRSIPVKTDLTHATPSGGIRRLARATSARERSHITAIEAKPPLHWVPTGEIDLGREMMRHGLLKRGVRTVADFYTRRNLWALSALWAETTKVEEPRIRSAVRFLITSFLPRVSRKAEYRTAGGAGNTHNINIPALQREDNVLKALRAKESDIVSGFQSLMAFQGPGVSCCISNQDATVLVDIPDQSIDYIFTDPPFGSNIFYADCSILWESWLNDFTDETRELVINERRQEGPFKTLDTYGALMTAAICEMYRVLKPGRWATIEFNNSDGRVFEAIKLAVERAGFEIANMLLLDKAQKTFKQLKGASGHADVVDKDVLFNLHKPAVARLDASTADADLDVRVVEVVRQHLSTLPERVQQDPQKYTDEHRTTATINSMLMNALIPDGVSVERLNLPFIESVCARYFRKIGPRWYLRGEAIGGTDGTTLFSEEPVVSDEVSAIAWLRHKLRGSPMLLGELKPYWHRATGLLPAAVSHALILDDLLVENFWRDPDSNRWREPTVEEREKMNDDRSLRVLHDAERFESGSLRRETTDEERCEWIDVLFHACRAIEDNEGDALPSLRGFDPGQAYPLIARLFHSVLRDHVPPEAYGRAEKQARAASARLSNLAEEEKSAAGSNNTEVESAQRTFDFKGGS